MDLSLIKRVNHITSPYTMLKNWHNGIAGSYFSSFLVTVSYSILKEGRNCHSNFSSLFR
jgi:hypothetical protein